MSAFAKGRGQVVARLVEIEVVVFVEENRHGPIAIDPPGSPDHVGNAIGITHAVTVKQEEIRNPDDRRAGNCTAAEAGADEQTMTAVLGPIPHAADQLVDPLGTEDRMIIADVALVVHLDQDVAIRPVEKPVQSRSQGRE